MNIALILVFVMSVFNITVSAIGYQCLKTAGKSNESNAKFLIFNIVSSVLILLGSAAAIMYASKATPNSPYNNLNLN